MRKESSSIQQMRMTYQRQERNAESERQKSKQAHAPINADGREKPRAEEWKSTGKETAEDGD
jgi:alpha-ketoglutarate-dependent taurine dioxygenase